MSAPDFEALRATRNASVLARTKKIADEYGIPLQSLRSSFNPNACYCACGSEPRGPCEHKWDGHDYESEDGRCFSVTCSRCGTTAMSHDLRVMP
jgi:hypothetical protein